MKRFLFLIIISLLAFSACDVHEWPEEEKATEFTLNLDFDTNLPLYQIIEHQKTRAELADAFDVRYIINFYEGSQQRTFVERNLIKQVIVSRDDVSVLNHSIVISDIPIGSYNIIVWADYVNVGTVADKYYSTENFSAIQLNEEHVGNSDFRDAFVGHLSLSLTPETTMATVKMERPLAKFNFITTDLSEFVVRVLELRAKVRGESEITEQGNSARTSFQVLSDNRVVVRTATGDTRVVDLNDFKVEFKYHGNMPDEFDMFLNKPVDARSGVIFNSSIKMMNDNEAELGFDYVFVNGDESAVNVSVCVYDKDNSLISSTDPIKIPITRSQLTTVRSEFLTSTASGGVGIDTEFNGEFNFIVP